MSMRRAAPLLLELRDRDGVEGARNHLSLFQVLRNEVGAGLEAFTIDLGFHDRYELRGSGRRRRQGNHLFKSGWGLSNRHRLKGDRFVDSFDLPARLSFRLALDELLDL